MTDLSGIDLIAEDKLVGSNPRDLALLKIMALQKDPASTGVKYHFSIYKKAFVYLAGSFFNLSPDLIKANFNRETINGLEELIMHKARKWSIATQIFMYCTPLIGWVFIPFIKNPVYYSNDTNDMATHYSYRFLLARKKLKKIGVDPISLLVKDLSIQEKDEE